MTYLILAVFFVGIAIGYFIGESDRNWRPRIRKQMERW